jgi:hypothetical protein
MLFRVSILFRQVVRPTQSSVVSVTPRGKSLRYPLGRRLGGSQSYRYKSLGNAGLKHFMFLSDFELEQIRRSN